MTEADLAAVRSALIRDEGTGPMRNGRYFPYRCPAGKLTLGIGRNLDDVGISQTTTMQMLDEDIDACVRDLRTFRWFLALDGARLRAVINLRFNLGPGTFRTFVRFIAAMDRRDYAAAAQELRMSAWAAQTKGRAQRIVAAIESGTDI